MQRSVLPISLCGISSLADFAAQKEAMRANVPEKIIKYCFPPMLAMGCMHSKLQILKYPDYLRIVVPTGNLVNYDWGETGEMENVRSSQSHLDGASLTVPDGLSH